MPRHLGAFLFFIEVKFLNTWELRYFIGTLPKLPRSIHELRLVQAGVPTGYSGRDALRVIKAKIKPLSDVTIGKTSDKTSWFSLHLNAVALHVSCEADLWHGFTVEAVAAAAHEMGHALQWRKFGAEPFAKNIAKGDSIIVEADAWMRGFQLIRDCGLLESKHAAIAKEVAAACLATYQK